MHKSYLALFLLRVNSLSRGTFRLAKSLTLLLLAMSSLLIANSSYAASPVVSAIPDQIYAMNTASSPQGHNVYYSVTDADTSLFGLSVTQASSNTALVRPAAGPPVHIARVAYFQIMPNVTGTAIFTVKVSDGSSSDSQSFKITVGNTRTTLEPIPNTNLSERAPGALGPPYQVALSVEDLDNSYDSLQKTATHDNPNLISSLSFPPENVFGQALVVNFKDVTQVTSANVTVRMSDGVNNSSRTFKLTYAPYVPVLSNLNNTSTNEDTAVNIPFNITYGDLSRLTFTATSSNQAVVSNSNISFSGSGNARTLRVVPNKDKSGNVNITVKAEDDDRVSSKTIALSVVAVNDAPTINGLDMDAGTVTIDFDEGAEFEFSVEDIDSNTEPSITIKTYINSDVLSPSDIEVNKKSGTDNTYIMTLSPKAWGTVAVEVVVSDGAHSSAKSFLAHVQAAPQISDISNKTIDEDTSITVGFEVQDRDSSDLNSLDIKVTSSNSTLFSGGMSITGTGRNRSLELKPSANKNGVSNITILVKDTNGGTASTSFDVVVNSINDKPEIKFDSGSTTVRYDISGDDPIIFSVNDVETPPSELRVTASPALEIADDIVDMSGVNLDRVAGTQNKYMLSFSPLKEGTVPINILISDEHETVNRGVLVHFSEINDPPQLNPILDQVINDNGSEFYYVDFFAEDEESSVLNMSVSHTGPPLDGLRVLPNKNQLEIKFSNQTNSDPYRITLRITDGEYEAEESFNLTFNNVNYPPEIYGDPLVISGSEGEEINFSVRVRDVDSPVELLTAVMSGAIIPTTQGVVDDEYTDVRNFSFTPNQNEYGNDIATITVTDDTGVSSSKNISLSLLSRSSSSSDVLPFSSMYEFDYSLDEGADIFSSLDDNGGIHLTSGQPDVSATGAATYRIPFDLPPVRNSFKPSLSLVYNSSSKRNLAGKGWFVSGFSRISRCDKVYVTEGVSAMNVNPRYSDADRLCLDGRKLIHRDYGPTADNDEYWEVGSTYRTESDSLIRVTLVGAGNSAYFQVEKGDGEKSYYGREMRGQKSKQYKTADSTIIKSWAIDEVAMPEGSRYEVHYKRETDNGVHLPLFIGMEPDVGVVFTYEDKNNYKNNSSMNDAVNRRYDDGKALEDPYILGSITSYIEFDSADSPGIPVQRLNLDHERSVQTSDYLLNSVTKAGYQNGTWTNAEPLTMGYSEEHITFDETSSSYRTKLRELVNTSDGNGQIDQIVDLNQDGYSDIIYFHNRGNIMQRDNPAWKEWHIAWGKADDEFDNDKEVLSSLNSEDLSITSIQPFMTAEGYALWITRRKNGFLSPNNGNQIVGLWTFNYPGLGGILNEDHVLNLNKDATSVIYDIDNDGLSDYLTSGGRNWRLGANLDVNEWAYTKGFLVKPASHYFFSTGDSLKQPFFLDVNNDGVDDVFHVLGVGSANDIDGWHREKDGSRPGVRSYLQGRAYNTGEIAYGLPRSNARYYIPDLIVGGELDPGISMSPSYKTVDGREEHMLMASSLPSGNPYPGNAGARLHAYLSRHSLNGTIAPADGYYVLGDFNGDGLKDYAFHRMWDEHDDYWKVGGSDDCPVFVEECGVEGRWYIKFNTGQGFTPSIDAGLSSGYRVNQPAMAYDYNGDGLDDLIYTKSSGSTGLWRVALTKFSADQVSFVKTGVNPFGSNSGSSAADIQYDQRSITPNRKRFFQGDVNNDGVGDVIVYGSQARSIAEVRLGKRSRADRLISVTNGFGVSSSFKYSTLSDKTPDGSRNLYSAPSTKPSFPNVLAPRSLEVVYELEHESGNTSLYQYQGGLTNIQGRGFLGFERRTVIANKLKTTSEFYQEFPLTGLIKKTETEAEESGHLVTRSANLYTTEVSGRPNAAIIKTKVIMDYGLTTKSKDVPVSVTRIDYKYNHEQGYLTERTTNIGGSYSSSDMTSISASVGSVELSKVEKFSDFTWDLSDWNLYGGRTVETVVDTTDGEESTKITQVTLDGFRVETETQNPGEINELKTSYIYSILPKGTVRRVTHEAADIDTPLSSSTIRESYRVMEFDSKHFLPKVMQNAAGHRSTKQYDYRTGKPIQITDSDNQLLQQYNYDAFGNLKSTTSSDGTIIDHYTFSCDNSNAIFNCPNNAEFFGVRRVSHGSSALLGAPLSTEYYDNKKRLVRSEALNIDGSFTKVDRQYYADGRLKRLSNPYSGDSPNSWTEYIDYDAIGRVSLIENPDGGAVSYSYSQQGGLSRKQIGTTVITPEGSSVQIKTEYYNALGQLDSVVDAKNIHIDYKYDSWGNLQQTQVDNNVSTTLNITYDNSGNKLSMQDPDAGEINFEYNGFGELRRQIWAKNTAFEKSMEYSYDALGRKTHRVEIPTQGSSITHSWYWDVERKGTLSSKQTGSDFLESYTYDANLRLETKTTTINGAEAPYIHSYTYDVFSRLETQTYPNQPAFTPLQLHYQYHATGHHVRIQGEETDTVYWAAGQDLNEMGQPLQEYFGNGVVSTRTYNAQNGSLQNVCSARVSVLNPYDDMLCDIQNLSYQFDSLGNLHSRSSSLSDELGTWQENIHESFTYDSLNRLEGSYTVGDALTGRTRNFDYDDLGNVLGRSDSSLENPSMTLQYEETGHAGIHAVTRAGENRYEYDAYGNVSAKYTNDNLVQSVDYDVFNKPTRIGSTHFSYGPDHERYRKINSAGEVTHYLGKELETTLKDGFWESASYLGAFAVQTVRREFVDAPEGQQFVPVKRVQYLHLDHLGSTETITDEYGNVQQRLSYDPWGQRQLATWVTGAPSLDGLPTDRGYTGHEMLDDIGLIHMNGRVYDPEIGRFLSPDLLIQAPTNTQSFNRYSYVFNNPLSLVDPSGYEAEDGGGGCTWRFGQCAGSAPTFHNGMQVIGDTSHLYSFDNVEIASYYFGLGWMGDTAVSAWGFEQGGQSSIDRYLRDEKGDIKHDENGNPITEIVTTATKGKVYAQKGGGSMGPEVGAVGTVALLKSGAKFLAARAAGGISAGVNAIAEDLGAKNKGYETIQNGMNALGLSVSTDLAKDIDNMYKVGAGGVGATAGGVLAGAAGASSTAFVAGSATVFLSSYALTRGLDNYTGNVVTGLLADGMCSVSGKC
ncbi:RHS repeat-associated core domain-containing protein [Agaribacterium sp. ZY112]|uniref:RHS repeat-associated core domain-containing protein n=1 Tax=Agaribacterium sp. ZY112 TaxID=3233574 RepID=UPI0035234BB8